MNIKKDLGLFLYINLYFGYINNGDYMKKILLIITISLLLTGCMGLNNTPVAKVEELFNKYQTLDESVINDLNKSLEDTNYTEEEKERYKEIMKEQYKTLTYKIKDDTINGDDATVEVSIMVKDFYNTLKEANTYFANNTDEFRDGNSYTRKYNDYKLNKLKDTKEKVTYTMNINLIKKDGEWQIDNLSDDIIDKINGIYPY